MQENILSAGAPPLTLLGSLWEKGWLPVPEEHCPASGPSSPGLQSLGLVRPSGIGV